GPPERDQRDGRGAARGNSEADLRDPVVERRSEALSMAPGPAPALLLGRRRGDPVQRLWLGRGAASTALLPLSWAFRGIVGLRRRLFGQGVLASHSLPVA